MGYCRTRRAARPGPTSGLEAEGSEPGGAGGMEKLPPCTRASSSWFSWFAVVPLIADGGCAAFPTWCVAAWRAGLCAGGIAELVVPIGDPIDPGGIAVAGGDPGYGASLEGLAGKLDSGEEGPGPPGTG